jgi:hypothetical protein
MVLTSYLEIEENHMYTDGRQESFSPLNLLYKNKSEVSFESQKITRH